MDEHNEPTAADFERAIEHHEETFGAECVELVTSPITARQMRRYHEQVAREMAGPEALPQPASNARNRRAVARRAQR